MHDDYDRGNAPGGMMTAGGEGIGFGLTNQTLHAYIYDDGVIEFEMTDRPNKKRGISKDDASYSFSRENRISESKFRPVENL